MSKARFFVCECGKDLELSHWDCSEDDVCVLTFYCPCGNQINYSVREIYSSLKENEAVEVGMAETVRKEQIRAGEQAVCDNLKKLGF